MGWKKQRANGRHNHKPAEAAEGRASEIEGVGRRGIVPAHSPGMSATSSSNRSVRDSVRTRDEDLISRVTPPPSSPRNGLRDTYQCTVCGAGFCGLPRP